MAPDMLQRYPIIGEFSYIKMMVVMILQTWNQERKVKGELAVAEGPLKKEIESIQYARSCFKGNYFYFVVNYNLKNRFSLVCYTAGLHHDVFNGSCESIENKLLLADLTREGSKSRGGSMFGNYFCYAILDWTHELKTRRAWMNANLPRYQYQAKQRWTKTPQ